MSNSKLEATAKGKKSWNDFNVSGVMDLLYSLKSLSGQNLEKV